MKNFLKNKTWPVFAGLLTAFVAMVIFEYVNSLFYPLPENLDWSDYEAVRQFTASLPFSAYILVFLGWIFGSFKAGCVTTYLSGERTYQLSFLVGIVLTILGIANNWMIGHDMLFNVVGLPMFIIGTYLGHRYLLRVHSNRRKISS